MHWWKYDHNVIIMQNTLELKQGFKVSLLLQQFNIPPLGTSFSSNGGGK